MLKMPVRVTYTKSFFLSRRGHSKKHRILFGQNQRLFQGRFYRNRGVGKCFCWRRLNSFSNTSVGPQINSTSVKRKKAQSGHWSYDIKLDWMYLNPDSFSSQLGIIFSGLFWKARMQMRGKILLSLQTSYANRINISKLFRTEASHHNQRSIGSYKQFCKWYRFRVPKFTFVEKMSSIVSFVFSV